MPTGIKIQETNMELDKIILPYSLLKKEGKCYPLRLSENRPSKEIAEGIK